MSLFGNKNSEIVLALLFRSSDFNVYAKLCLDMGVVLFVMLWSLTYPTQKFNLACGSTRNEIHAYHSCASHQLKHN